MDSMGIVVILLLLVKYTNNVRQLLKATKESLYLGIEQAIAGNHVGDIGCVIQNHCQSNRLRELYEELNWAWHR